MTSFDLYYINSEGLPQIHQLSTAFFSMIEEVFETLDTEDINMTSSHLTIEPMLNRNYGNKFQYQNGPNMNQHIHKNTSQQHQHKTLVNSINPDLIKYPGLHQYHT